MFIPNNTVTLFRSIGNNAYGQSTFETVGEQVACSIVKLQIKTKKTEHRKDSSASHGAVEEDVTFSTFLFLPAVGVKISDRVVAAGFSLDVSGVQPRFDVLGNFDHVEVSLEYFG
jgi:hypothetical protein